MSALRDRLSYANVMATIAVFLALGGISWAAATLPRNSVGAVQLKKNAVTGSKVKDRSLTAADFRKDALPAGPKGDPGTQGAKGDPGATGPTGPVEAFTASYGGPLVPIPASPTFAAVVVSPTLPAGAYTLTGRVNLVGSPATSTVICSMADDAAQNVTVPASGVIALSMSSTARLAAPGTVSIVCTKSAGTPQSAQASITATRVATLTGG